MQRGISNHDRRKLIQFQSYLEERYPLTSYHVADISDYVKLNFVLPKKLPMRALHRVRLKVFQK